MKTCYNGAGREVSVTGSTDNFVSSVAYAGAGVYGSDGGMTGLDVAAMTNKIKGDDRVQRSLRAAEGVAGHRVRGVAVAGVEPVLRVWGAAVHGGIAGTFSRCC